MSSMATPNTRSKKIRRLGPRQVMHADQYEALDVDSVNDHLKFSPGRSREIPPSE